MPRVTEKNKVRAALVRARIKAILDKGGFKHGEVGELSKELGITRQYISFVKKHLEDPDYRPSKKLERRQRATFTPKEKAEFIAVLRGAPPSKKGGRIPAGETGDEKDARKGVEKVERQIEEIKKRSAETTNKKLKRSLVLSLANKKRKLREKQKTLKEVKKTADLKRAEESTRLWTPTQAKNWFFRRFGRQPKQRQLKLLADEIGLTFAHDDKLPKSQLLGWEAIYLDDEFRAWQKSPQAIELHKREAELARLEEEDRKKNPHLYEIKKRGRGRPKQGDELDRTPFPFDGAPLTPNNIGLPKPEKSDFSKETGEDDFDLDSVFEGEGMDLQSLSDEQLKAIERSNKETLEKMGKAGLEYPGFEKKMPVRALTPKIGRNDPCPFDASKKFKRCCGAKGGSYCLKQSEPKE